MGRNVEFQVARKSFRSRGQSSPCSRGSTPLSSPLHSLSFHIPCFFLHDIHGARGLHRQALSVTVAGPADRWGSINRQVDGMCQSTWGSSDGPSFSLRTPVVRRPACSSSLDLGSGEPGVLYHGGARWRTRWLHQVGSQRQEVG